MASVVLSTVGRAVGTAIGGPIGGQIGAAVGGAVGTGIDAGRGNRRHYEGARLEELAIQSSAYGRMIPIVFGTVRLAGNLIWARPLKELQTTTSTSQGGKGGGSRKSSSSSTSYSYYATIAIAICEGEITRLDRVWADAKLLDLSQGTYRIYRGGENQLPDPLIESFEGIGTTPAYRGMAYVVIEDFPIGDFGNRIPNFTFEVVRQVAQTDGGVAPVEELVTSVMLIPGSGEFVYDTQSAFKMSGAQVGSEFIPQGYRVPLNQHTAHGHANMLVALDQMQETFPNLEWVGVVVNWFGSSMDIASCAIAPRVEYTSNVRIEPQAWQVAGLTRSTAALVGNDAGVPRFGGTPDDASIQRLCETLRARGLKVFFYPMMQMDVAGKPWRGYLTGASGHVANFFTKANGYNAFVMHYANLVAGRVDAFAIGSELRDLTAITSSAGVFPAVGQLVSLAANVRAVLGSGVKLTYAADWSEYHHTNGGWYHLDPLWASNNIDMVGIDAYFPLTNATQNGYDIDAIRDGWHAGEGYDFYYTDSSRTETAPLAPAYAWKNIAWWWNNAHVNPNSATTAWVPGSKPIWFTEYGFASVDGCANEPNRFIDPSSTESAYPRFSRGRVDFMAQRAAIAATELEWAGSSMVANKFLWTWDARPYPYWPDLQDVWADGANWVTGHWVQGKLGASHVAAAVEQIAAKVGIAGARIDTSALQQVLDGFVIHQRVTARAVLSQLMQAYFFTMVEREAGLVTQLRDQGEPLGIAEDDCVPIAVGERQVSHLIERQEDLALPETLEVHYLDRLQRYETQVQSAARHGQDVHDTVAVPLGLVLSAAHAQAIANRLLTLRWSERMRVSVQLPMRYAALEPGDRLQIGNETLRIEQIHMGRPGMLKIAAIHTQAEPWDGYIAPVIGGGGTAIAPLAETWCEVLDIPALPGDRAEDCTVRVAASGTGAAWQGASLLRESSYGDDAVLADIDTAAVMGRCLTALPVGEAPRVDYASSVDVSLIGSGTLTSTSIAALLDGANVAVIGGEIIQFAQAEPLSSTTYRLRHLLRGRLGTEWQMASHYVGERFVLLNSAVVPLTIPSTHIGQAWMLRAVSHGTSLAGGTVLTHTLEGMSLRPYAPVHLQARWQSGNDIMLSWVRRARIDGGLRDAVDVPLNEAGEAYEVRIMQAGTIKRSWRALTTSQIYSSAEQLDDFGSNPTSVTVAVAQISALVGPGIFATEALTVS